VGVALGIAAAIVLSLGGLALWGDSRTDAAGYIHTDNERFATSTHALATDDLDIDDTGWLVDHDVFGHVRITADAEGGKPLFVGIAPKRDVDTYLAGTAHTELTDVDYSPFDPTYRDHPGQGTPPAPASSDIWVASTHGSGTQTLNWDVEDGDWSVVVMNADGSSGVDANVSAGAKITWLDTVGWSLLGAGVLMLAGATALVVSGARRV
jgi:hypothetical protein